MNRFGPLVLAVACAATAPPARAGDDTRLLSMPAISSKAIAFVYGEDLWTADPDGKNARRLTSDLGLESNPAFNADGSVIAFSAQYEGNTDVYTVPAGGGTPTRLTTHPAADLVRGFAPGGEVLFMSNRNAHTSRHAQFYTVPLTGGMSTRLPIPWGFEACYSPDGSHIAYTPARDASAQWKHYRGGTHGRVWIYDVKTREVVEVPQPGGRCNDLDPNWVGDTLFFRSDRAGEYNVYAVKPTGQKLELDAVKPVTDFKDFPVLDISHDGKGTLIFERAGWLYTMPVGQTPTRLTIAIATDSPEARPRFAKGAKYVRDAAVSPSGARAAVEFRGEIVTVPADKGDPRPLTRTPGVHERGPSWSPDGKTIAYFSDAGGEYRLTLAAQDGKGEPRVIAIPGGGFYYGSAWSRDSKKLLVADNSHALFWVDAESGKATKIATDEYGRAVRITHSAWSPDNKWVAYSLETPAHIARVYVYSLEQNKSFPVTDGKSEADDPVFDASGKYLYFVSSDSTGLSKHGFSLSSADARPPRFAVYLAVLAKGRPRRS